MPPPPLLHPTPREHRPSHSCPQSEPSARGPTAALDHGQVSVSPTAAAVTAVASLTIRSDSQIIPRPAQQRSVSRVQHLARRWEPWARRERSDWPAANSVPSGAAPEVSVLGQLSFAEPRDGSTDGFHSRAPLTGSLIRAIDIAIRFFCCSYRRRNSFSVASSRQSWFAGVHQEAVSSV